MTQLSPHRNLFGSARQSAAHNQGINLVLNRAVRAWLRPPASGPATETGKFTLILDDAIKALTFWKISLR